MSDRAIGGAGCQLQEVCRVFPCVLLTRNSLDFKKNYGEDKFSSYSRKYVGARSPLKARQNFGPAVFVPLTEVFCVSFYLLAVLESLRRFSNHWAV